MVAQDTIHFLVSGPPSHGQHHRRDKRSIRDERPDQVRPIEETDSAGGGAPTQSSSAVPAKKNGTPEENDDKSVMNFGHYFDGGFRFLGYVNPQSKG